MTEPESLAGDNPASGRGGLPLRAYLRRMIWIGSLPLVALSVYQGAASVAQVRQSEDEAGARLVHQTADAVEQTLRSRIATMQVLARSPTLDGDTHLEEFHRLAAAFKQTHVNDLILADTRGRMLLHTGHPFGSPLPPLPRPKGRAALPLALSTGEPAVGDSFIGPLVKTRLVAVAVPVQVGVPGERALLSVLTAQSFQELLERASTQEGWVLRLLDGQGQVLARVPARSDALTGDSTHVLQTLLLVPWTVEVEMSAVDRWAPVRRAALLVGLSILTATLAGVLAGTWAGSRIAAAVAALAHPGKQKGGLPAISEIAAVRGLLDASMAAQREAGEATSRSEATFRAMFDGLFDAVVLTDPERVIRLVNPAFTAMFGYGAEEAIGHRTDFMYVDDTPYAAAGQARFSQDAENAAPWYRQRYRRKDGSAFWAESVGLRVAAADGQLLGFLGLHRDITQREHEQDRLRVSEELFATAFANNPAAIALTRLQGGEVLDVNQSWLAMTGESRESIIGQSARFMWPEHEAERFVAALLERRTLRGWEQTFHKRNGEPFEAEISSQIIEMDGELAILSTLIDISARKRAEHELQELAATLERRVEQRTAELAAARDAAQTASRAKSAFLANMSHEIRTPMNAILGLTHLVARDAQDPLQSGRLAKIEDAALHLLQVINDILDLSKIEADKMVLDDVEFALDEVLSESFEMVSGKAREKELELVLDAASVPSHLRGDPTRLKQLLVNLLNNAVKFTDKGWVRLECYPLRVEAGRLNLRFEVQDTGTGMTAEEQARIFDAFEQADSSITRRHGGTGLGLALSRHLVALMGGDIGVVSAPSEGSRFWFNAWFAEAPVPPAPSGALVGHRVLLVDELPQSLAALRNGLARLGLQVDAMPDAESALRQVAAAPSTQSYDLALLSMPARPRDATDALRRLHEMLGRRTPAILLLASDEPSRFQEASTAMFDGCHVKPLTVSGLRDALLQALGDRSVPSNASSGGGTAALDSLVKHRGQRVLLVEDVPVNREVAQDILGSAGLVVETAENGAVAVELALLRSYDLILMDMQMPVLDGLSAARAIRERAGWSTPIIAMTANAFSEDRDACLRAGMNDHVAKPVSAATLFSTLLRWLPPPGGPVVEQGFPTANDRKMSRLERLSRVEDYDYAVTLENLGGKTPILERTLRSFVDAYRESDETLTRLAGAGDIARCREACHALRGHYAILGSKDLQNRLEALERALRKPAQAFELAGLAHSVDTTLVALVARLEEALTE